jgi:hypothetical protein
VYFGLRGRSLEWRGESSKIWGGRSCSDGGAEVDVNVEMELAEGLNYILFASA